MWSPSDAPVLRVPGSHQSHRRRGSFAVHGPSQLGSCNRTGIGTTTSPVTNSWARPLSLASSRHRWRSIDALLTCEFPRRRPRPPWRPAA